MVVVAMMTEALQPTMSAFDQRGDYINDQRGDDGVQVAQDAVALRFKVGDALVDPP